MTTTGTTETSRRRSGRINTKQFKIWLDLIDSPKPLDVSTLADRHKYTNREVTTAIGRMDSPPVRFEDGFVWFDGTSEEKERYRRSLTAERYCITEDMCDVVLNVMSDLWMTVTDISKMVEIPPVYVSRTLVVVGDRVVKKSISGGTYYRLLARTEV